MRWMFYGCALFMVVSFLEGCTVEPTAPATVHHTTNTRAEPTPAPPELSPGETPSPETSLPQTSMPKPQRPTMTASYTTPYALLEPRSARYRQILPSGVLQEEILLAIWQETRSGNTSSQAPETGFIRWQILDLSTQQVLSQGEEKESFVAHTTPMATRWQRDFAVVWLRTSDDSQEVRWFRLDPGNQPQDWGTLARSEGPRLSAPRIATFASRAWFAWIQEEGDDCGNACVVWTSLLAQDPAPPKRPVPAQEGHRIQHLGLNAHRQGGAIAAWEEHGPGENNTTIVWSFFPADPQANPQRFALSTDQASSPSLARLAQDRALLAWVEGGKVHFQTLTPNGEPEARWASLAAPEPIVEAKLAPFPALQILLRTEHGFYRTTPTPNGTSTPEPLSFAPNPGPLSSIDIVHTDSSHASWFLSSHAVQDENAQVYLVEFPEETTENP